MNRANAIRNALKTVARRATLASATFGIVKPQSYYANDLSVFTPTIWAKEAIYQLQSNMVMGNLIHRDFENELANYGDTVNVVKPGTFTMKRKGSALENVVIQDATATSIAFKLNQNPHISFMIADTDSAKSIVDLFATYLTPAVQGMAQGIDRIAAGQAYNYFGNGFAGHLGSLDSTTINDYLLDTRERQNLKNVPENARQFVIGSRTETIGLKERMFVRVNESGDPSALRRASLGQLYGYDLFAAQSQPSITQTGQKTVTALINNATGYVAGTTVMAVDTVVDNTSNSLTALPVGSWITIAGDDVPQHVTASGTSSVTISPGLQRDIVDNAKITAIGALTLANSTDGAIAAFIGTSGNTPGWAKSVGYTGSTAVPQIGQMLSFGSAGTDVYTVIGVDTVNGQVLLDRPLATTILAGSIFLLPIGQYNLAFQRNALAMAVRPLPKPKVGALSDVVNYNGLSLRVTITYDGNKQGHLVTIDCLMGIAPLDTNLGMVMLG